MKRTFSTGLAYVFGIAFAAWGVVLMEKADFGVSMVVAPAYLFRYTLGVLADDFRIAGLFCVVLIVAGCLYLIPKPSPLFLQRLR